MCWALGRPGKDLASSAAHLGPSGCTLRTSESEPWRARLSRSTPMNCSLNSGLLQRGRGARQEGREAQEREAGVHARRGARATRARGLAWVRGEPCMCLTAGRTWQWRPRPRSGWWPARAGAHGSGGRGRRRPRRGRRAAGRQQAADMSKWHQQQSQQLASIAELLGGGAQSGSVPLKGSSVNRLHAPCSLRGAWRRLLHVSACRETPACWQREGRG